MDTVTGPTQELLVAETGFSIAVTVTAGMLLFVLLVSSSVASGCLPQSSLVNVMEVVSMIAGESIASEDVDPLTIAGDCVEDSVLDVECCC